MLCQTDTCSCGWIEINTIHHTHIHIYIYVYTYIVQSENIRLRMTVLGLGDGAIKGPGVSELLETLKDTLKVMTISSKFIKLIVCPLLMSWLLNFCPHLI